MPITDRNLGAGTKLVATYKKERFECLVLEDHEGNLGFELIRVSDGQAGEIYKSLSAAGSAVMGGVACNGWRFWTPEGEVKPPSEPKAKTAKTKKGALLKQIRRVPNQKGVPEGSTKWFCSACMKGFVAEWTTDPETCPEGHAREVEDTLAP